MEIQEALSIAKHQKPRINYFSEYKNSFVFDFDDGVESDGGDGPIVVPKNGSECVNFVHALTATDYLDGPILKEGAVS